MTRPLTLEERTRPVPDDPAIHQAFGDALRGGHPVLTAATRAGIDDSTAWVWIAKGRQELERGEVGTYAPFASTYKEALADFAEENLAYVRASRDTGCKGWLPAMTLLERRIPSEFSRRTEVKVESTSLTIHAQLPVGSANDIIARYAARQSLNNPTGETPQLGPGTPG